MVSWKSASVLAKYLQKTYLFFFSFSVDIISIDTPTPTTTTTTSNTNTIIGVVIAVVAVLVLICGVYYSRRNKNGNKNIFNGVMEMIANFYNETSSDDTPADDTPAPNEDAENVENVEDAENAENAENAGSIEIDVANTVKYAVSKTKQRQINKKTMTKKATGR